jgi:AcrR family transcriptional regulator
MSTRDRIIDAAAEVMRTHGVAHATTKQIARAADCSEALLYKHFPNKTSLLLHVLRERMPPFENGAEPGKRTVESNLTAVAHGAMRFYLRGFPMMASMVAQPELMASFRGTLNGAGPRRPVQIVAEYLAAERELGRIRPEADPVAVAELLMGACFQQGFLAYFEGKTDRPKSAAARLVRALEPELSPQA